MTAIGARRLLALVLTAAGSVLLVSPRHAPAQVEKSGGFVSILFDSATASPAHFSPDGDGIQDSVLVTFTLPERAEIFVYVSPAGLLDTVRVLYSRRTLESDTVYEALWFGEDETGLRQPEGLYTVHFLGTGVVSGRELVNARQVQLDLTPPTPQILQVEPRAYTPTIPGNEALPSVRVRLSNSSLADQIGVNVLDSLGLRVGTLEPAGGFGGDGDYLFLCSLCADDSTLGDGIIFFEAFGQDEAGNDSTVVDSMDKNIAGPTVQLSYPFPLSVQHADSLVGQARDRQNVDSLWVRFVVPGDTMETRFHLPRRGGGVDQTYPFVFDLGTFLSDEGTYPLTFEGLDENGVSAETQFVLHIDRTAPPAPRPEPALPKVVRTASLTGTVAVDSSDTEVLVVSGGVGGPDSIPALSRDLIRFTRTLATGPNTLRFEAIDLAGNVSAATQVSVRYDLSSGLFAPERFHAGDQIEFNAGQTTAQGVVVQILAMDGTLVRIFRDSESKRLYSFTWDLRTPEGHEVLNGAYLVVARVRRSGTEERFRTMVAVVR